MSIKLIFKKFIGEKRSYKLKYSKKIKKNQNINLIKAYQKIKIYNTYSELFENVDLNTLKR